MSVTPPQAGPLRPLGGDGNCYDCRAVLRGMRAFSRNELLSHQPKPDDGKMVIECVCEADSRPLHDGETGGING
jgi:hypothetical protein